METKAFKQSIDLFNKIDRDRFSDLIREEITPTLCIQWWLSNDYKICIVQFYEQCKGYQIYEPEKTK